MRKAAFLLLFALLACPAFAEWERPDLSADLPKKLVQADPTTMLFSKLTSNDFKNDLGWDALVPIAFVNKGSVAVLSDDIVKDVVEGLSKEFDMEAETYFSPPVFRVASSDITSNDHWAFVMHTLPPGFSGKKADKVYAIKFVGAEGNNHLVGVFTPVFDAAKLDTAHDAQIFDRGKQVYGNSAVLVAKGGKHRVLKANERIGGSGKYYIGLSIQKGGDFNIGKIDLIDPSIIVAVKGDDPEPEPRPEPRPEPEPEPGPGPTPPEPPVVPDYPARPVTPEIPQSDLPEGVEIVTPTIPRDMDSSGLNDPAKSVAEGEEGYVLLSRSVMDGLLEEMGLDPEYSLRLPVFNATLTPGAVGLMMYELPGFAGTRAGDIVPVKVLSPTESRPFTFASTLEELGDGKFAIVGPDKKTLLGPDDEITEGCHILLGIADGGPYDCNDGSGAISDPMFVSKVKAKEKSSGGGCDSAALSSSALLLLLPLALLAIGRR